MGDAANLQPEDLLRSTERVTDLNVVPTPGHSEDMFSEPHEFVRLRQHPGPVPVVTMAGHRAWLFVRHADVKAICADRRIGRSHANPEGAPRLWSAALMHARPGPANEMVDHERWRAVFGPTFSARSIELRERQVRARLDELLDDVVKRGTTADLSSELARPFALAVISDVIGLPLADRPLFAAWSDEMRHLRRREAAMATSAVVSERLDQLLDHKRQHSCDDLLSQVGTLAAQGAPLTRLQLIDGLKSIFLAGFDTVASRMEYGILYLFASSAGAASAVPEASKMPLMVEELIRTVVPGGSWIPRYALADVEYGATRIRRGDLVVLALQGANRDPAVFDEADTFRPDRSPNPHLGFGYGKFYCLGASLARLQLRIFFPTLFARLPGMALSPDCDPEVDIDSATGGLSRLMVTWSGSRYPQQ
ncbi:cytochrome P450 [Micromonospora sp. NPDC049089]|uniref:cytochrome P450 n=1 Tax=Micromonospora sp. NPDC049089 TaxID=3155496 RepID=UPI0033D6A095